MIVNLASGCSSNLLYLSQISSSDELKLSNLPNLIRSYNSQPGSVCRLYFHQSRERESGVTVLRFIAPDVFRAFITLRTGENDSLCIDTVVAFGPREKVLHDQTCDKLIHLHKYTEITLLTVRLPSFHSFNATDLVCFAFLLYIFRVSKSTFGKATKIT